MKKQKKIEKEKEKEKEKKEKGTFKGESLSAGLNDTIPADVIVLLKKASGFLSALSLSIYC